MMETMEAVELEKQKHNSTRMETLTRLAKLEVCLIILLLHILCSIVGQAGKGFWIVIMVKVFLQIIIADFNA